MTRTTGHHPLRGSRARRLAVPLALALSACASTSATRPLASNGDGAAPTGAATSARPASSQAERRRELSPRARRLFDEAVGAADEQRRLKVPVDWEVLESRWRAVTEVEAVPEAFFNLGVALDHRGRAGDARAAYRRALQLDPELAPAAVNLALLDEPADPRQAAQAWGEVLRRFPEEAAPRVRLAALYEAAGQHDDAWRLAREALMRDPRSTSAYKVMMRVALRRDRFDLAQLLAVKAGKLDDADPEIVALVGEALLRQKDEAGAVAQWKKAIAMKEDYLPARYALLSMALSRQHWEGVVEQAGAILRTSPSDARVHLALGVAYRHLGEPDKALAAYDDAERAAGDKLAEVHLARGVALAKGKERCEPALIELKRYLLAAGPAAASDSAAPRLERECEQILVASRQAEEAAREMKAQAEREAARNAAAAGHNSVAINPGGAGSPPNPTGVAAPDKSDKVSDAPTRSAN